MTRSQGILLPLFSLPSPYGIGTMGQSARDFIDFLSASGQSYWQLLPMGPTSYGDSPYQSFSTFAGNPYFIDLDLLVEDGLLTTEDLPAAAAAEATDPCGTPESPVAQEDSSAPDANSPVTPADPASIDYGHLYETRFSILRKAYAHGKEKYREEISSFRAENPWVVSYALFMSIKSSFAMVSLSEWPDEALRQREEKALAEFQEEHKDDISFWIFLQFLFYRQWNALRDYAHEKGIRFIGDLPIYVAMDSADVWSEPENFLLNPDLSPKAVAGVPPDAFSEDGQLWGNPLYDYDYMKNDGFGWWIRRVDGAGKLYDVIRIDHFRGFESYWSVPAGSKTAKTGEWIQGPGMDLVGVLTSWFPKIQFIAEDLGVITPAVQKLLTDSRLPGMKVLQFAFESGAESQYLPHNITKNSVTYVGTHDNDTCLGFVSSMKRKDRGYALSYLGLSRGKALPEALLRAGMASVSDLFVLTAQDLLSLGSEGRINTPGTLTGNWTWRLRPEEFEGLTALAPKLRDVTRLYGRLPKEEPETGTGHI